MRTPTLSLAAAILLAAPALAFAQSADNPPGTAAGRAVDRAAGTNTSGAYPAQSDGTAENPKGTVASRTAHRAKTKLHHASRKTQTLRNNSATRALDRTAGTDNSGAYPKQADGTAENPKGTAVSRALGTTDHTPGH